MKRLVIFSLLLTLAGWSEGLSGLEYAADTVGGKMGLLQRRRHLCGSSFPRR